MFLRNAGIVISVLISASYVASGENEGGLENPGTTIARLKDLFANKQYQLDCLNKEMSIGEALFENPYILDKINSQLDVTYTTNPALYEGCGTSVPAQKRRTIHADPLTDEYSFTFEVRRLPAINLPTLPGDNLKTLIVLDPNMGYIHGVYINVRDSLSYSTKILRYFPSVVRTNQRSPIVFLLFSQQSAITRPFKRINRFVCDQKFLLKKLKAEWKLEGPIAVTWLDIVAGTYLIDGNEHHVGTRNCASLSNAELLQEGFPYYSADTQLSVNMEIQFHRENIKFEFCGENYNIKETNFTLTPMYNSVEDSSFYKNDPTISLSSIFLPARSFFGIPKFTTLLLLDPDVYADNIGTVSKPLIHWAHINIQDINMNTGENILPYVAPGPPDDKPHRYVFLLIEQNGLIAREDIASLTSPCFYKDRCRFDVRAFLRDKNIVGASIMRGIVGVYQLHFYWTELGQDEKLLDAFCPSSTTEEKILSALSSLS